METSLACLALRARPIRHSLSVICAWQVRTAIHDCSEFPQILSLTQPTTSSRKHCFPPLGLKAQAADILMPQIFYLDTEREFVVWVREGYRRHQWSLPTSQPSTFLLANNLLLNMGHEKKIKNYLHPIQLANHWNQNNQTPPLPLPVARLRPCPAPRVVCDYHLRLYISSLQIASWWPNNSHLRHQESSPTIINKSTNLIPFLDKVTRAPPLPSTRAQQPPRPHLPSRQLATPVPDVRPELSW